MTASDDRMVAVYAEDLAQAVKWQTITGLPRDRLAAALDGPEVIPVPVEDVAAIKAWWMEEDDSDTPRAALDRLCALYDPPPPPGREFDDETVQSVRKAVDYTPLLGWSNDDVRRVMVAVVAVVEP